MNVAIIGTGYVGRATVVLLTMHLPISLTVVRENNLAQHKETLFIQNTLVNLDNIIIKEEKSIVPKELKLFPAVQKNINEKINLNEIVSFNTNETRHPP